MAGLPVKVLFLPEGTQGLHLQSAQIEPENGVPFLFTYSDGKHTVSLQQLASPGASIAIQPAATIDASLVGPVMVRGDKEATFTELRKQAGGKISQLAWREGDIAVLLYAESVERDYLVDVANALVYLK